MIELGICATRAELSIHEPECRPRTPDALNDRGRDELTGTNGREDVKLKGSFAGTELVDGDAAISKEDVVPGGATKICD